MADMTPMMQQYQQIKEQHPDCLLFFRLGDFYEMFQEDARVASRELDLTLTTRDRGKAEEDRTPMCGVPYHASESYIARLVAKGYKVAICEQMEDPAKAKGLVKREIIRVVTPGTVTESSMLDESKNNFFACTVGEGGRFGVAFCDISTGQFSATLAASAEQVVDELGRFQPAEVLLGGSALEDSSIHDALQLRIRCCVDQGGPEVFELMACQVLVMQQFGSLREDMPAPVVKACGGLLTVLRENQKSDLSHVRELDYYATGKFLDLDLTARRNLELTQTLRTGEKRGSLLWVLDHTKTPMGGRMLRSWLAKPLLDPRQISKRQEAVEELVRATVAREELILLLRQVSDLERVMARIVTGTCNCRDLRQLAASAEPLPKVKKALSQFQSPMLHILWEQLDDLGDLREEIDRTIVDEPPFSVREGGMIRTDYNQEINLLFRMNSCNKNYLASIENREKEKTGIKNLKVGYNRVFGYYIEIPKSQTKGQSKKLPDYYMRKQTLANCERFISPELKELENNLLNGKERMTALEYEIFDNLRSRLAQQSARVQQTASALACADVLSCFAANAVKYNYCRPEVELDSTLEIEAGRHPVVEQVLQGKLFVPNDTSLDSNAGRVAIITGPNMAGKSTYMRQVALIVLMAQIGSFVPARKAHVGVVDRLFTRIGASDDLTAGQSTFMVEMQEVAEILKNATSRSLLILDEIGRGTATYDGMAIARAVLEYAADPRRLGAKTLFATHYHELTVLDRELDGVKNYNISVKKRGGDMIFLRKIVPGPADQSYGVEVAKLAGLPDKVVSRARALLKELEAEGQTRQPPRQEQPDSQVSMEDLNAKTIREKLAAITVETMTPIEAMNTLYELKKLAQE